MPHIIGLDQNKTEELLQGLKEQLFALEGHQDNVLLEYILVLLSSGNDRDKVRRELETFMSSRTHCDQLVRWLFDKYGLLKTSGDGLKSVVMISNAAAAQVPTSATKRVGVNKPLGHHHQRSASKMLKSVVNSVVKANSAGNPGNVKDARELINLKRRPAESGRLVVTAFSTKGEAENREGGPTIAAPLKTVRCPQFPNCPLSEEQCPKVHPKEVCKYFPNCVYGKECLYLHPPVPCRFTPNCTNQFCNFTHDPIDASPAATAMAANTLNIPCKFNGHCRRPDCPFLHTLAVPCPHGSGCMRPACPFTHPSNHAAPVPRSLVNRPCKFGRSCAKTDCPFLHPTIVNSMVIVASENSPGGTNNPNPNKEP